MRATRAYVAGFGTAGSLLAGAAVLFVIASAVVSFRGWPQIAAQGPSATLANVRPAGVNSTAASRRLASVPVPSPRPSGTVVSAAANVAPRATLAPVGSQAGPGQPISSRPISQPSQTTTQACPGCRTSNPTQTQSGSGTQLGTVVQGVTGGLGTTVSNAGQNLGSTVTNIVNTVATQLSGSALGGVARSAGSSVAGTLSSTTQAVGSLLGPK